MAGQQIHRVEFLEPGDDNRLISNSSLSSPLWNTVIAWYSAWEPWEVQPSTTLHAWESTQSASISSSPGTCGAVRMGTRAPFRVFYRDPLYTELAQAALPHWQELQETSGVPLIHLCGFLAFAAPGNLMMKDNLAAIQQSGAPFEQLAPAEISSRFPALQIPSGSTTCFTPQAGFLDADRCVATHLAEAGRLGATMHGQVTMEHIEFEYATTQSCEPALATFVPTDWSSPPVRGPASACPNWLFP